VPMEASTASNRSSWNLFMGAYPFVRRRNAGAFEQRHALTLMANLSLNF
jgi:hypothetical protein